MLSGIRSKGSEKGLDESAWHNAYPMIASTITAEDVGIRMMKKYFEIEASKATQQY